MNEPKKKKCRNQFQEIIFIFVNKCDFGQRTNLHLKGEREKESGFVVNLLDVFPKQSIESKFHIHQQQQQKYLSCVSYLLVLEVPVFLSPTSLDFLFLFIFL